MKQTFAQQKKNVRNVCNLGAQHKEKLENVGKLQSDTHTNQVGRDKQLPAFLSCKRATALLGSSGPRIVFKDSGIPT